MRLYICYAAMIICSSVYNHAAQVNTAKPTTTGPVSSGGVNPLSNTINANPIEYMKIKQFPDTVPAELRRTEEAQYNNAEHVKRLREQQIIS